MQIKKMLRNLGAAALAAVLALSPITAAAQGINIQGLQVQPFKAKYVSQNVTAADTDIAMYVKFFGPGGVTGTTTLAVEAAGTGDLTFVVNGAAYAGFECPVSGALGGVIDVSDAACDTLGEVVDTINATATTFSTGYFRAVIANGLRSDSSNASLLARAASTLVAQPEGQVIFWDSSVLDDISIGLWDPVLGIRNWLGEGGRRLPTNPFADRDSVLQYASILVTNAGTIGNYEVYCVTENYRDGRATSSETVRTVYLEAGAATTVTGKIDEFINAGGLHCPGGKMFVRALASGADTSAVTAIVTGYQAPLAN